MCLICTETVAIIKSGNVISVMKKNDLFIFFPVAPGRKRNTPVPLPPQLEFLVKETAGPTNVIESSPGRTRLDISGCNKWGLIRDPVCLGVSAGVLHSTFCQLLSTAFSMVDQEDLKRLQEAYEFCGIHPANPTKQHVRQHCRIKIPQPTELLDRVDKVLKHFYLATDQQCPTLQAIHA
ncbi:hypothetical protein NHX12_014520 [Muraenolepis orangiensis]|uniref:Uncharacterized protein n=1 Tax=Muraenolepis orangiensis TaxID=630683 RepID=A0A9Q0I3W7_9TELE|nr:hypothetical protein NHX12_014520 [Muraenolepis orangiensis]